MAKCKYDWPAIRQYFEAGHTLTECCERFGFHIDAWYKAIGRGLIPKPPLQNRGARERYDWAAVQRFYDEGHSYRECRMRFGFCAKAWDNAVKRGAIKTRDLRWPIDRVLREGAPKNVKARLLAEGFLENRCSQCGITDWRGKHISIQIDHINGINTDNRLENLRMLCPNCHSQTETFGARNKKATRLSRLV
ncbi:MAG: HNH endonuclease signature motif containing protein [Vulcanimicrobiaceae bacterium]